MAVWIARGIEEIAREAGEQLSQQAVEMARAFAPNETGQLANKINAIEISPFKWRVSTHASNHGFEYPAHIEAGQEVYPTNGKALKFRIHGREIIVKKTKASSQAGFMKKTMENLHI